jgi:hypothetical protein
MPLGLSRGVDGGFGPPAHPHLVEEVADVVLHGLLGKEDLGGDLPICLPLGEQFEDSSFLTAQSSQHRILGRAVPQPLQHSGGHRRVEQGPTGTDLTNGVDDVVAFDLFEDVPRCTGHDRLEECLIVIEGSQHEAGERRMSGAELAAQFDTVPVGKPNIQDCHVWGRSRDPMQSFLDSGGFADDLEVVLGFEHVADAPTDDLMVVDEKDAQGHREIFPQARGHGNSERKHLPESA